MARTRSKSPRSKSKSRASRSPSKAKAKKPGKRMTTLSVSADRALQLNLLTQGMYMLVFFGARGDASDVFFGAGSRSSLGPLCGSLPLWMGLTLTMYNLNTLSNLREGTDKDKKKLCFVRSVQWCVWFCMIMATGRKSYHGRMVDSEFYTGAAVSFIMSVVSKLGSEGVTVSKNSWDMNNTANRCFAVQMAFVLFNTFNCGVMGGEQYFSGETMNAVCQTHVGFFTSFIFLSGLDLQSMMLGGSNHSKHCWFRNSMLMQALFVGMNVYCKRTMDQTMLMVNYAVCAVQLLVAYMGYKATA